MLSTKYYVFVLLAMPRLLIVRLISAAEEMKMHYTDRIMYEIVVGLVSGFC